MSDLSKKKIELEHLLQNPDQFPLVVMTDHLEDPYNFGAIIRSCVGFGARAVIYPKDRQVTLTEGVVKASAGTAHHLPLIRVTNLAQTVDMLAYAGFWIYGLDGSGRESLPHFEPQFPCVLIAGNEHRGLSPLLKKKAHALLKIPISANLESLNVSVATGVALYQFGLKHNKI